MEASDLRCTSPGPRYRADGMKGGRNLARSPARPAAQVPGVELRVFVVQDPSPLG